MNKSIQNISVVTSSMTDHEPCEVPNTSHQSVNLLQLNSATRNKEVSNPLHKNLIELIPTEYSNKKIFDKGVKNSQLGTADFLQSTSDSSHKFERKSVIPAKAIYWQSDPKSITTYCPSKNRTLKDIDSASKSTSLPELSQLLSKNKSGTSKHKICNTSKADRETLEKHRKILSTLYPSTGEKHSRLSTNNKERLQKHKENNTLVAKKHHATKSNRLIPSTSSKTRASFVGENNQVTSSNEDLLNSHQRKQTHNIYYKNASKNYDNGKNIRTKNKGNFQCNRQYTKISKRNSSAEKVSHSSKNPHIKTYQQKSKLSNDTTQIKRKHVRFDSCPSRSLYAAPKPKVNKSISYPTSGILSCNKSSKKDLSPQDIEKCSKATSKDEITKIVPDSTTVDYEKPKTPKPFTKDAVSSLQKMISGIDEKSLKKLHKCIQEILPVVDKCAKVSNSATTIPNEKKIRKSDPTFHVRIDVGMPVPVHEEIGLLRKKNIFRHESVPLPIIDKGIEKSTSQKQMFPEAKVKQKTNVLKSTEDKAIIHHGSELVFPKLHRHGFPAVKADLKNETPCSERTEPLLCKSCVGETSRADPRLNHQKYSPFLIERCVACLFPVNLTEAQLEARTKTLTLQNLQNETSYNTDNQCIKTQKSLPTDTASVTLNSVSDMEMKKSICESSNDVKSLSVDCCRISSREAEPAVTSETQNVPVVNENRTSSASSGVSPQLKLDEYDKAKQKLIEKGICKLGSNLDAVNQSMLLNHKSNADPDNHKVSGKLSENCSKSTVSQDNVSTSSALSNHNQAIRDTSIKNKTSCASSKVVVCETKKSIIQPCLQSVTNNSSTPNDECLDSIENPSNDSTAVEREASVLGSFQHRLVKSAVNDGYCSLQSTKNIDEDKEMNNQLLLSKTVQVSCGQNQPADLFNLFQSSTVKSTKIVINSGQHKENRVPSTPESSSITSAKKDYNHEKTSSVNELTIQPEEFNNTEAENAEENVFSQPASPCDDTSENNFYNNKERPLLNFDQMSLPSPDTSTICSNPLPATVRLKNYALSKTELAKTVCEVTDKVDPPSTENTSISLIDNWREPKWVEDDLPTLVRKRKRKPFEIRKRSHDNSSLFSLEYERKLSEETKEPKTFKTSSNDVPSNIDKEIIPFKKRKFLQNTDEVAKVNGFSKDKQTETEVKCSDSNEQNTNAVSVSYSTSTLPSTTVLRHSKPTFQSCDLNVKNAEQDTECHSNDEKLESSVTYDHCDVLYDSETSPDTCLQLQSPSSSLIDVVTSSSDHVTLKRSRASVPVFTSLDCQRDNSTNNLTEFCDDFDNSKSENNYFIYKGCRYFWPYSQPSIEEIDAMSDVDSDVFNDSVQIVVKMPKLEESNYVPKCFLQNLPNHICCSCCPSFCCASVWIPLPGFDEKS